MFLIVEFGEGITGNCMQETELLEAVPQKQKKGQNKAHFYFYCDLGYLSETSGTDYLVCQIDLSTGTT